MKTSKKNKTENAKKVKTKRIRKYVSKGTKRTGRPKSLTIIRSNSNKMCSVYNCNNRSTKYTSLHKLPKQDDLFKEWWLKTKMGRKPTDNTYVCSNHFDESVMTVSEKGVRLLKRGAIPTKNLPEFSDLENFENKNENKILSKSQLESNKHDESSVTPVNQKPTQLLSSVKNKQFEDKHILDVKDSVRSINEPEWSDTISISNSLKVELKLLQDPGLSEPEKILPTPPDCINVENSLPTFKINKQIQGNKGSVLTKTLTELSKSKSISDKVILASNATELKRKQLSSSTVVGNPKKLPCVNNKEVPEKIIVFKDLILRKVSIPKSARLSNKKSSFTKLAGIADKVELAQDAVQNKIIQETSENLPQLPDLPACAIQEPIKNALQLRLETKLGSVPPICIDNKAVESKMLPIEPNEKSDSSLAQNAEITKAKVTILQDQYLSIKCATIIDLIQSDNHLKSMTSLSGFGMLDCIIKRIENLKDCAEQLTKYTNGFSLKFCVLLVLIKMNKNYDFHDLAMFFQILPQKATEIFCDILPMIRAALKTLIHWPAREKIHRNMPLCFNPDFKNVRSILDCTTILVKKNNCQSCKIPPYQQYNGETTFKFLVCLTPSGLITFVSRCYSGKATDKLMFEKENLIEYFEPGDVIIVRDFNGFASEDELQQKGIQIFRTSSSNSSQKFTKCELSRNKKINKIHVHVEQVIKRIKGFKILKQKVDNILFDQIDDIMFVCGCLANFSAIEMK